jgi:uncharacterized protein YndB with AHSA1/START domain
MDPDVVTVKRKVKASPAVVFSYFTDREKWLSWQAVADELDPRPGGVFRMSIVEPNQRIVLIWGWKGGSSTVEIQLEPERDDTTAITLVHSGLPLAALGTHREMWRHSLDRLASRAASIVVMCACGQRWEGTADDVISQVQQHGIDVHNMAVTPEQVLAMAQTGDRP